MELTRRVRPKSRRKPMISLVSMGSQLSQVRYLGPVEEELYIEIEIGQLEQNIGVAILRRAWTRAEGHLVGSSRRRQRLREQETSWTQHWKFKSKRRTKKVVPTTISREIPPLRLKMKDLIYYLNSTTPRVPLKITTNSTRVCTIMLTWRT